LDDRRRDGGTNSTLRTKEQGTHLTLNEQDDDEVVFDYNFTCIRGSYTSFMKICQFVSKVIFVA